MKSIADELPVKVDLLTSNFYVLIDFFPNLPREAMKVVALISGGKDSCFNMLHCVANGHEIEALANLKPLDKAGKGIITSK